MTDSTKRIPHDKDAKPPIRPEDDAGPDGQDVVDEHASSPSADRAADADVSDAEKEIGTGRYVSREKADPAMEERLEEADRRTSEDLGRGGDA